MAFISATKGLTVTQVVASGTVALYSVVLAVNVGENLNSSPLLRPVRMPRRVASEDLAPDPSALAETWSTRAGVLRRSSGTVGPDGDQLVGTPDLTSTKARAPLGRFAIVNVVTPGAVKWL